MCRATTVIVTMCAVALSSRSARAQSSTTLVDQMSNLFQNSVVLAKTPAGVGVAAHTPVFTDDPRTKDTLFLINQVSSQIGSQVSTFPVGSSAGGFTYAYDAALGTFTRSTQTFGPAFAERAPTIGKGKFSFGMNYVHAKYGTLDGKNLENGDIKINLLHQTLSPPSFVEGDVIQTSVGMKLSSDITAFLFNYGVTDRLDIGLAVPIVRVSMDLTYHATILDFATHGVAPATHVFANGGKTQDFNTQGSASGVGDLLVRGKYSFPKTGAVGTAVGVDLHLPTGDDQNMLGSGTAQTEVFAILSGNAGNRVAPHLNIGYTFAGKGAGIVPVSNQFNYVGGLEVNVTPGVTIVGDFIGRRLDSTLRLSTVSSPHTFQQGPTAPVETTTLTSAGEGLGSLTSVLGTAGVKFNPWRNLLISAHVLFPMNDAGLRSKPAPVIGFDYAF